LRAKHIDLRPFPEAAPSKSFRRKILPVSHLLPIF
jgi:hypothetical protein